MYNRVILMGRLTKDPELRTTQSGITMCRFSVAVERGYAKQGEDKQTDFFEVTCWRQTAEFVSRYFSKGRMIHIEGTIQNNNYTDQNGVKHYATVIMAEHVCFTGEKQQASQQPAAPSYASAAPADPAARQAAAQALSQVEVGDLGEFEEILSDGEAPF